MEKKRRMKRRSIATLLATVLLVALMAIPAAAATTYTPVAGTSCTFNKYLIMDAGDTVPNATFSFTVTAGSARSEGTSDNTVMQVLPGVVVKDASDNVTSPSIADVTFSNSDTTVSVANADVITALTDIDVKRTNANRGGTAGDTVQLDAGEKYATKQATVSFSGITFSEPGIYRYIITETASAAHAAAGIIHDTDVDRVLDVYVTDNGSGSLVVAAYVLHTTDGDVTINSTMGSQDVATAAAALADKTDGFTNEYTSKDLVFKKEVSGNQASRDKYFEFTATLDNVNDNDVFTVSLADDSNGNTTDGNADATSGTTDATITANREKTNPTSVTGKQLKAGVKFYLQHGQSIAIRGIAPNATYTITENAEDYKSTAANVTDYKDKTACETNDTIGSIAGTNKAVKTSFTNTRDGIIPTGILLSATPWIILGLVVIAGIVFFAIRSRKKYEEE